MGNRYVNGEWVADKIEEMIGVTMISFTYGEPGEDELWFEDRLGNVYKFYHDQGCCESGTIGDVCGDLMDLLGSPILQAEEVSSEDVPQSSTDEYGDTYTWTFYKFSTIRGSVTVKWCGSSNGRYSESVDFRIDRAETNTCL